MHFRISTTMSQLKRFQNEFFSVRVNSGEASWIMQSPIEGFSHGRQGNRLTRSFIENLQRTFKIDIDLRKPQF
jgi:hypothetical protein